jgi:SAM-dependent methyltransferase
MLCHMTTPARVPAEGRRSSRASAPAGQGSSLDPAYTSLLTELSRARWKRFVPNPYRWNIRRLCRGRVLDVGCGIGRALGYLDGRGIGVDPNPTSVAVARRRGAEAYTPDTMPEERRRQIYDSLLCSHVLEHLTRDAAQRLLLEWLPLVRRGGAVVLICPQERGFASQPDHVTFLDSAALLQLCGEVGLVDARARSFPLPRTAGRWWAWNESVVVARAPGR